MDLIYLDSAHPADLAAATASGLVSGVTTNPSILRASWPDLDPRAAVHRVLEGFPTGRVFHQLHAPDADAGRRQLDLLLGELDDPARLVLKLPAQPAWLSLGAELVGDGLSVAFTALYHPGQYVAAAQAGAEFVIPYVDRARRLRPDADPVVVRLAGVRRAGWPRILAASVKSADQAVEALACGADAVSAPWDVLDSLWQDELTDSAVEQFRAEVPW